MCFLFERSKHFKEGTLWMCVCVNVNLEKFQNILEFSFALVLKNSLHVTQDSHILDDDSKWYFQFDSFVYHPWRWITFGYFKICF